MFDRDNRVCQCIALHGGIQLVEIGNEILVGNYLVTQAWRFGLLDDLDSGNALAGWGVGVNGCLLYTSRCV